MGVKFQNLILRDEIDLKDLAGKIIAIDAPNIIMSLFNFARKNLDGSSAGLILDRTQRPISHLYGLLYRTNFYYTKKILPIYCFDGKVSELKRVITKDQLKDYLFTRRWYEEAMKEGKLAIARQIALSSEYMWKNIIDESKALLGAMGIPYIESPSSAESQCAHLVKQDIAHYSNSQDFDSLLFGCPRVIQNLSKSLRRKVQGKWKYQKVVPLSINLRKNLNMLGISLFQLVDLSLLIETDYFPGISKIGPKKGLKLIKKHGTIEKVISGEKYNHDFSELTPDIIMKIRKLFLFPEVINLSEPPFWALPNMPRIHSLLCEDHHLNEERVSNNVEKLKINYQKTKKLFTFNNNKTSSVQITFDKYLV